MISLSLSDKRSRIGLYQPRMNGQNCCIAEVRLACRTAHGRLDKSVSCNRGPSVGNESRLMAGPRTVLFTDALLSRCHSNITAAAAAVNAASKRRLTLRAPSLQSVVSRCL